MWSSSQFLWQTAERCYVAVVSLHRKSFSGKCETNKVKLDVWCYHRVTTKKSAGLVSAPFKFVCLCSKLKIIEQTPPTNISTKRAYCSVNDVSPITGFSALVSPFSSSVFVLSFEEMRFGSSPYSVLILGLWPIFLLSPSLGLWPLSQIPHPLHIFSYL